MRILLWSSAGFETPYPSYHLMESIIRSMLSSGHEVRLIQIVSRKDTENALPESLRGVPGLFTVNVFRKQTKKSNFVKRYIGEHFYYLKSAQIVRGLPKPDVAFVQSTNTALFPIRRLKRLGIPTLYNVQDIFPLDAAVAGKISVRNPFYRVVSRTQRSAYLKAARVVTVSDDMAKTLSGLTGQRVTPDVIYNWSYRDENYAIPDKDNHFLQNDGYQLRAVKRVVYAGNIGLLFDINLFIGTAERLMKRSDVCVIVIGDGSRKAALVDAVRERGLTNVSFFPYQPMCYAPDNYAMAHVNIFPLPAGTLSVCMPSKINTALLCGKPCVASMDPDTDMARRLTRMRGWHIVKPGDADAMAAAVLEAIREQPTDTYDVTGGNAILGPVENAGRYTDILCRIAGVPTAENRQSDN